MDSLFVNYIKNKYYIYITEILHFYDKSPKGIALLRKNGKIKLYLALDIKKTTKNMKI